jgi:hypothetical protein
VVSCNALHFLAMDNNAYHFKVAGLVEHDPVHKVSYSYLPRSTQAVGAGSAGHPLSLSQHNIPPSP